MSDETIFVYCVGSGRSGWRLDDGPGMCRVCGRWFNDPDAIPGHDRPDIIAMINRGDYDT